MTSHDLKTFIELYNLIKKAYNLSEENTLKAFGILLDFLEKKESEDGKG